MSDYSESHTQTLDISAIAARRPATMATFYSACFPHYIDLICCKISFLFPAQYFANNIVIKVDGVFSATGASLFVAVFCRLAAHRRRLSPVVVDDDDEPVG